MGLDMYLTKKTYVGAKYKDMTGSNLNLVVDGKPVNIDVNKVSYISEEVGYWRKFNALHGFIINKYAGGVDECQEIYLNLEQLQEILNACKTVLEDNLMAKYLMPTTEGFFFGAYDYDEFYFEDVERTVELLEEVLKQDDGKNTADYFYRASW